MILVIDIDINFKFHYFSFERRKKSEDFDVWKRPTQVLTDLCHSVCQYYVHMSPTFLSDIMSTLNTYLAVHTDQHIKTYHPKISLSPSLVPKILKIITIFVQLPTFWFIFSQEKRLSLISGKG